jgi:pimeloyl-ACP methyl ester carboxylesterase
MNLTRTMRLTKLRITLFSAAMAIAGVLAMTSQAATARAASHHVFRWDGGTRPVIVLKHGAWADASGWGKVIRRLQGDGFTTYAPPNPLRGLPQDSAYLHDFLTQSAALAGRPVVLVGHSYGGAVIAATQRPLAASAFTEPSGPPAWATIPSWAVIGTADRVIPPAELTFMAQRAGAHITDVNAGHLSMISDPQTVAQVIEQAAQATS